MLRKISLRTLLIFSVAALSGGLLFYTSQNVQRAEGELREVRRVVLKEQEAMRVLRAEWAFLNSPARLEGLAAEYLSLRPPGAGHIAAEVSSLPDSVLPERSVDGFRDVSFENSVASDVFVTPRRKPVRKNASVNKRFDALLNELETGGGE